MKCRYVVSVSGGKDSTATALHLKEQGIEFSAVFADTGWEHPATYDYISTVLEPAIGPIVRVGTPGGMKALIRRKGIFPRRIARFCTSELKVKPILEHLRELAADGTQIVNVLGIRAAESLRRSKMPEREEMRGANWVQIWRPILGWSFDDVVDIHRRHKITPNPLYIAGASRVGCAPCIFARKSEIKMLAAAWPARVEEIRSLEREISTRRAGNPDFVTRAREICRRRVAFRRLWPGRGFSDYPRLAPPERLKLTAAAEQIGDSSQDLVEELEVYLRATFFGRDLPGTRDTRVDAVIEWSRTGRGGRQFELFDADDGDDGCMRWGLCDVIPGDAARRSTRVEG